jgi:hypothetical protein
LNHFWGFMGVCFEFAGGHEMGSIRESNLG